MLVFSIISVHFLVCFLSSLCCCRCSIAVFPDVPRHIYWWWLTHAQQSQHADWLRNERGREKVFVEREQHQPKNPLTQWIKSIKSKQQYNLNWTHIPSVRACECFALYMCLCLCLTILFVAFSFRIRAHYLSLSRSPPHQIHMYTQHNRPVLPLSWEKSNFFIIRKLLSHSIIKFSLLCECVSLCVWQSRKKERTKRM